MPHANTLWCCPAVARVTCCIHNHNYQCHNPCFTVCHLTPCVLSCSTTGVHMTVFSWLWSQAPGLAAAVALNWALGSLSVAKWGLLLLLASSGRVWLYFLYLVGKVIDQGLARLAPGLRRFFWASFVLWSLYVVLSPVHYYPLPFWPFAPGSFGPQEAFQ